MRLFNIVYCVLNTWVVCSSLKYCEWVVQYMCMLHCILVYVNLCIVICKLNVECSMYMNSVNVLGRLDECTEHTHAEQAKLSRYSLC